MHFAVKLSIQTRAGLGESFCHDRSVLTNSLVIVFLVKNLILYLIKGQFDPISWLTTSIFPTILLTAAHLWPNPYIQLWPRQL